MSEFKHQETPHCTCGPQLLQWCSECCEDLDESTVGEVVRQFNEGYNTGSGCWKCGGDRLLPPFDEESPLLIVHKDM